MTDAALIGLSAIVAGLRIFGVRSIAFQAIAHLWFGAMFGVWLVKRDRILAFLLVGLTVVETACFLVGLFVPKSHG